MGSDEGNPSLLHTISRPLTQTIAMAIGASLGGEIQIEDATSGSIDMTGLDQLKNERSRVLLDTVDNLRRLQVGDLISLPQIIVVGDQSSGKSSVLEAISRTKFPVRGDVCTRFATELILRRAQQQTTSINIQWADTLPGQPTANPFEHSNFAVESLPDFIKQAEEQMRSHSSGKAGFYKDVLRVEISRPDVYPLTLVDLPGFFESETAEQDKDGVSIVNDLVESYMKQSNTIILAVVSANLNLSNQKVLQKAKAHDTASQRTLGVITKPDLAIPGSANEEKFLTLANNDEARNMLALGWHVLRNTGEIERVGTFDERDIREELFFQTGAWSELPESLRGIKSLRKKLSNILQKHIQHSLPSLIASIETNLAARQTRLEGLGQPRSTTEELRAYLIHAADEFQRLSRDAIGGRYDDKFFGDDSDEVISSTLENDNGRKLRANVRRLNRAFNAAMLTKGGKYDFQLKNGAKNRAEKPGDLVPEYLKATFDRYQKFADPQPVSETVLEDWLINLASGNQGKEFPGLPNSDLIFKLFQRQAEPWNEIARFHVGLVMELGKSFVYQLVEHALDNDTSTATSILRAYVDTFFRMRNGVLGDKLDEILRPYSEGACLPLEIEFRRELKSDSNGLAILSQALVNRFKHTYDCDLEEVNRILLSNGLQNGNDFGTEKLAGMMLAYYQMSLRTFTENVVNLAVENCLVSQIPSIFTTREVAVMDEAQLQTLASESSDIQSERRLLQKQIKTLTEALEECNLYRPRTNPAALVSNVTT